MTIFKRGVPYHLKLRKQGTIYPKYLGLCNNTEYSKYTDIPPWSNETADPLFLHACHYLSILGIPLANTH